MKVEILGICLTPFPIKWAGKAAKQVYHKLRQKDTGSDATSRTFLQGEGSVFVQPLSLAFARQGRVAAPKVTERASPAGKSRCAAMGRLFVRVILSQCQSCLAAALPSQSGLRPPAPPKGEPLACRSAFVWTSEAQYLGNGSAPLPRPATA